MVLVPLTRFRSTIDTSLVPLTRYRISGGFQAYGWAPDHCEVSTRQMQSSSISEDSPRWADYKNVFSFKFDTLWCHRYPLASYSTNGGLRLRVGAGSLRSIYTANTVE